MEEIEEYDFYMDQIEKFDIMCYQINRNTDTRPWTFMTYAFTEKGHYHFFKNVLASSFIGNLADIGFIGKLWTELNMPGDFDMDVIQNDILQLNMLEVATCYRDTIKNTIMRKYGSVLQYN